mmetsp:Transcript_31384/g.78770  ORF Transcript_31384/g.78770 Transcript_31384/m.78770 type:complete len:277 (+) Transcript_31384:408-1238(+)
MFTHLVKSILLREEHLASAMMPAADTFSHRVSSARWGRFSRCSTDLAVSLLSPRSCRMDSSRSLDTRQPMPASVTKLQFERSKCWMTGKKSQRRRRVESVTRDWQPDTSMRRRNLDFLISRWNFTADVNRVDSGLLNLATSRRTMRYVFCRKMASTRIGQLTGSRLSRMSIFFRSRSVRSETEEEEEGRVMKLKENGLPPKLARTRQLPSSPTVGKSWLACVSCAMLSGRMYPRKRPFLVRKIFPASLSKPRPTTSYCWYGTDWLRMRRGRLCPPR